jgi:competence protein CoiA
MPLRCLDPAGRSHHAFDLSEDRWRALLLENRKARHLRMPCCGAAVTLKRSPRGKPFFAHKAIGACTSAAETEEHRELKTVAIEAARAHGWMAEAEASGLSPAGERWQADVLARRGRDSIALEVQWSGQASEEILRRQERYRKSGILGVWLLRRSGFPITPELPAAGIDGSLEEGFRVRIPICSGHQEMPMAEFLHAVFGGRFRFGMPPDGDGAVSVRAGPFWCWSCGALTRIVTGVDVAFGPHRFAFRIPELGAHPRLLRTVLQSLPDNLGIGAIRRRFSRSQGRSYASNGCRHCGVLIGEHYELEAWHDQETVLAFPIRISPEWVGRSRATPSTRRPGASVRTSATTGMSAWPPARAADGRWQLMRSVGAATGAALPENPGAARSRGAAQGDHLPIRRLILPPAKVWRASTLLRRPRASRSSGTGSTSAPSSAGGSSIWSRTGRSA